MKNRVPALILVVVFAALAWLGASADVAPTSSAVQIPEALKLAIDGLILGAVTLGLQVLFDSVGLDLRGLGAGLAVVLSGFAIAQLQGLIDLVPAAYDQLVAIVLNVFVVILAGLGSLRALLQPSRAAALFG